MPRFLIPASKGCRLSDVRPHKVLTRDVLNKVVLYPLLISHMAAIG